MPRLEVKCLEKVLDFRLIKVDGQIVWPIAGALLVARRSAGHLVVIAECPDEVFRVRFVGCQSTIACKLLRAGYFNENVLQTGGEADDAVCLALAGDDCLCSIQVIRCGRHRAAAARQRNYQRYPDDGANHTKIHQVRLAPCRMPCSHAYLLLSLRRPSQWLFMASMGFAKSSTHPANYMRSSADVKNLVPSKKRFGRLNTEMNVAPLGACATWTLPPGRHTKSPAPQLPSESSSDPSSMKVCSSAVCSCNGTTAPGAILNRMVERPSSSWYRIFISIPSNAVGCQGIDDAATKVDRSSGGLTGKGLFMASSTALLTRSRRPTPCPRCRSTPPVWALALVPWSQAGTGLARSPPPIPSPRSSARQQGPGRATRCSPSGQNSPAGH